MIKFKGSLFLVDKHESVLYYNVNAGSPEHAIDTIISRHNNLPEPREVEIGDTISLEKTNGETIYFILDAPKPKEKFRHDMVPRRVTKAEFEFWKTITAGNPIRKYGIDAVHDAAMKEKEDPNGNQRYEHLDRGCSNGYV